MQNVVHIKVNAKDGAVIPVVTYKIEDDSKKGVVIISHGFGEHSGAYLDHADRLWQGGYASVILDQRGHGKPPEGAKNWYGVVPHYNCFIDDVASITEFIKKTALDTPIAIYGHSMGGNIVLNTLLSLLPESQNVYFCAMVESPWLELFNPINPVRRLIVRLLNSFAPGFRNRKNLRPEKLTSDPERVPGYLSDPYYHGFISMRLISGIMSSCKYIQKNAAKLHVKTYIAYAKNDVIVSNKEIQEFAENAGDITIIKEYPSHHAIYNDVCREQYCKDLIAFMDGNLG